MYYKNSKVKGILGSTVLLYLIWPVGALFISLQNYKQNWSRDILWLFCIFFGFTFIIAGEGGSDSARYAERFIMYAHSDLSLEELWRSFYSEGSKYVDIASPLVTYSVSRITDDPSMLFTVFGVIFGYFFSRNLWYVLDRINGKITGVILLYVLTFAFFNPIWNINGFRMWTAAQIFLFGTMPFLIEGKSKKLIWSAISVLFHFSFLFPLGIVLLFIIVKNRLNIYLGFFIITSFIKEIDLLGIQSVLTSFLPSFLHERVETYVRPEYAESISETRQSISWFLPLCESGIKWTIYILVLYISFFGRKMLKERQDLTTLLCFSLLFYGFSNIFSLIPSGGRFLVVANTLMFAFFIIFLTAFPKIRTMQLLETFSTPFLLLYCIVAIRIGMDYFGLATLISNPILSLFYKDDATFMTIVSGFL